MLNSGDYGAERTEDARSRLQTRVGDALQVLEVLRTSGAEYLIRARIPRREDDAFVRVFVADPTAEPESLARAYLHFEQRAEIAARLAHPNIVAASALQDNDECAY